MKWEMEIDEIEAVLETIWDLHDKLSDAIHSVSRIHFLNSIKSRSNNNDDKKALLNNNEEEEKLTGFVFIKGFGSVDVDVDATESAIQESKSLNEIRTALENLEDQLEFFHTVQIQQRAERDTAIARLEQSRIVLATRLADHHGKAYSEVIEQALAFVIDVHDASPFVSRKNFGSSINPSSTLMKFLVSSFNFAKNSLKLDHTAGILGSAALVAVSMLAVLHFHQVGYKEKSNAACLQKREGIKRTSRLDGSSRGSMNQLDVLLARG